MLVPEEEVRHMAILSSTNIALHSLFTSSNRLHHNLQRGTLDHDWNRSTVMVSVLPGGNLRESRARFVRVKNNRLASCVAGLSRQVVNDSSTTAFISQSFVGVRGV